MSDPTSHHYPQDQGLGYGLLAIAVGVTLALGLLYLL
jgi:hypothetical protein